MATLKTVGPALDDKLTVTDYRTGETMAGVGIFFQQVLSNSFTALDGVCLLIEVFLELRRGEGKFVLLLLTHPLLKAEGATLRSTLNPNLAYTSRHCLEQEGDSRNPKA